MVNTENIENIDTGDIWSLNSISEVLKKEFKEGNYEQALELAERGLNDASNAKDKPWIDEFTTLKDDLTKFSLDRKVELHIKKAEKKADSAKFDDAIKFFRMAQESLDELEKLGKIDYTNKDQLETINKSLEELQEKAKASSSQNSSLNSRTDYDDLTIIKGIGNSAELKLNEAGIYTISQLAKSTSGKISKIKGFGVNLSEQIISSAKELLSENGAPEVKKNQKNPNKAKNLLDFENELSKSVGPMFESKFSIDRTSKSVPPVRNQDEQFEDNDDDTEVADINEIIKEFENQYNKPSLEQFQEELEDQENVENESFEKSAVEQEYDNSQELDHDNDNRSHVVVDDIEQDTDNINNFEDDITEVSPDLKPQLETFIERDVSQEDKPIENDVDIQTEFEDDRLKKDVSPEESSIEREYDASQELNYDNGNGSHVVVEDIEQDIDNIDNDNDNNIDITEISANLDSKIKTKSEETAPTIINEDIEIEKQVVEEKNDSYTDDSSTDKTLFKKNRVINNFLSDYNEGNEVNYRPTPKDKDPKWIRSVLRQTNEVTDKKINKPIKKQQEIELNRLKDEFIEESLTKDRLKAFQNRIEQDLKALKYVILPKSLIKHISKYIDLVAVKVLKVDDYTELIIILPVKMFTLIGTVMVSYDNIDYRPAKNLNDNAKNLLLKPNLVGLKKARDAIFQSITNEGSLFRFFKKYLKDGITLEKTKSKKRLFFRSGSTQFKLLIEPILTCQNEPASLEKSLLFPYQRQSNFHVINLGVLPALTRFLEKKYELIETHLEQVSTIKSYFNSVNSLMANIKLCSIPFVIFGFIFFLILIFQANLVLKVFISLGYAAISIYGVILFYLYFKFYKKKTKIIEDFNTPYHLTKFKMDETDLIMINEELDTELMNQFIYECFGKDLDFNLIAQLEEERSYNFINANNHSKTIRGSSETKHSFNKSTTNKIKSKYSSFLED